MSKGIFIAAVASLLAAQPCAAQAVQASQFDRHASGFVGLNVRMPLGQAVKPKPLVRLQVTSDFRTRDGARGTSQNSRPKGLEIGLLRSGKPALFFNGQTMVDMQTRLGFAGSSGKTTLIIGGVLLAVVVIAVAAGGSGLGDTCPTVGGSRDHCINP